MSNSQKNFLSIRSKLIAAVAMLLVASFMVVSSTYAWFTLSTAPEVTGITTQVGANGNLEIALYGGTLPINGMGNALNTNEANRTWGNIISLVDKDGKDMYGLSNIVLKPALLALGDGLTVDTTTPLVTPTYGADGRVKSLSKNGFYGAWNGTGFVRASGTNQGYGVRALGTASSMTAQQLLYANASSSLKTNLDAAYNAANLSLSANGSGLVTLILKGVSGRDSYCYIADDPSTTTDQDGNPIVETNELVALGNMISTLGQVPANLELAIKNFMLVAISNKQESIPDNDFNALVSTFNNTWGTTDGIFAQLKAGNSSITVEGKTIDVPSEIQTVIAAYNAINTKVAAASAAYDAIMKLPNATEPAYKVQYGTTVEPILNNLMDVTKMTVNDRPYSELIQLTDVEKINWAVGIVTETIQIGMLEGSGVYASIASLTKNIDAGFKAQNVMVTRGGVDYGPFNLSVRMYTTVATGNITNLSLAATVAFKEPAAKDAAADAVISDTYGYVLDFAFRTNASGSSLLLQQSATDRIYGDNAAGSETWGGGSYMEFSTMTGFGEAEVKNLMTHIRIVFVDTLTGEILAGAGLMANSATFDGTNVKATVALQEISTAVIPNTTLSKLVFGAFKGTDKQSQSIVELGQNEVTYISAYVYLDGETITNADIAAVSQLSTSGKLNLQFASSAELKPMDYSDLKNQGTQTPVTPEQGGGEQQG